MRVCISHNLKAITHKYWECKIDMSRSHFLMIMIIRTYCPTVVGSSALVYVRLRILMWDWC